MLLQRQPNQKAADLAAELGVSVRTLHRYFTMLDEMGIPVYSERGPYGGFSLVRGYKLPPLIFTPEEAVAICLGVNLVEALWGVLYRSASHGALAKLENVLPDEQRHEVVWARRSLIATGMHRSDFTSQAPALGTLRKAAHEQRRVYLTYLGGSQPDGSGRELDPYALVHRWGWWYVVGFCHLRQEVRTFRVDRIDELSLLEDQFSLPTGFDIETYLDSELQSQPQITAQLRFAPEAGRAAQESRAYWESFHEQPDGSILVSVTSPTLEWAASTALAYGPVVEVLEPPELRQIVANWASEVADKYGQN
jgi:predicted DNA-binding transcriptional regulator YafY